jgi:two-component system, NtrC family, sensor histidine kinase GlrK
VRLASKMFLTSALVIVVLAGVGILSLRAVDRLVSVNREITTRTLPALHLTASVREAIAPLARLEAHAAALGDVRYRDAWTRRAERVAADLEHLSAYMQSAEEARRHTEAIAQFERYRAVVGEEHARLRRGDRAGAQRLVESDAQLRVEELQESLDGLMAATHTRVIATQAEAARLEAFTWTQVLGALGAAVALALIGTAIVAHRMTRSLRRLSTAAADVASGAFREPLAVTSRDEIGALTRSFNAMGSQLRRMEDMRQEFFASVSHEFRSPLTSIRSATELLRELVPGPLTHKQERLMDIISTSSGRLLLLVNEILEISRLHAGTVRLDRHSLDLAKVVDHAVEELYPRAADAGVSLEFERLGTSFDYYGDAQRLHQMVVNLGANAIRFTGAGGRVVVRVIDAGPEFELQVEDTGVGIPADALPHIFDAYRQAHRARGGTGLGLAIVRSVVAAHGGRVTAESQEGKGSRFTVLLPRP